MSAAIQLAGDAMTGHTGEKYSVGGAPTREKVAASVTSMDSEVAHQLVHRKLTPRQIQLLALAGTGPSNQMLLVCIPSGMPSKASLLTMADPVFLFCSWCATLRCLSTCAQPPCDFVPSSRLRNRPSQL